MSKEKIKSAIEKTIRYMNGNYYSKFEEKMIVGYLKGALKELEDWVWQNLTKAIRVGDLEMGSLVTIAQSTLIAKQIMMIINK